MFTKKNNQYEKFIRGASLLYNLDPKVLAALILTESSGNPNASRYEPAFFSRYIESVKPGQLIGKIPVGCTLATEMRFRAFSFGLCQIMGQTAREFGFDGIFLSELFDPEKNIYLGAKILRKYIDKAGSLEGGLLKYNGGGDTHYPERVLDKVSDFSFTKLIGGE